MKRTFALLPLAATALLLAPVIHADVKTKEHTQIKLAGVLGGFISHFGGSAGKNGVTSTVAVKGNRLSRLNDATGQIIDLGEEKVYDLNVKKKTYKVTTFDELRQRLKDAQAKAQQQAQEAPPQDRDTLNQNDKQIEFDANVQSTGQHKTVAGYDTHETIVTITAHEKDKKIEESGGFIMTSDMWLGPKLPALDEIAAFERKYFQAVYGEALGIDPQQMAGVMALYPSFSKMAAQMLTAGGKLDGTPLLTTMTFESVKSPEAMKEAEGSSGDSGGGLTAGLGGMFARRLRGKPQQKSEVMTMTTERLSVDPAASADDVAIPTGYKEEK